MWAVLKEQFKGSAYGEILPDADFVMVGLLDRKAPDTRAEMAGCSFYFSTDLALSVQTEFANYVLDEFKSCGRITFCEPGTRRLKSGQILFSLTFTFPIEVSDMAKKPFFDINLALMKGYPYRKEPSNTHPCTEQNLG
jgi:hypothetical protein